MPCSKLFYYSLVWIRFLIRSLKFCRRFWTRNRPGDTILDKTDEMLVPNFQRATGIIFKNIDLQMQTTETDKQDEIALPGLGLEKEVLDLLNEEYKDEIAAQQQQQSNAFSPTSNTASQVSERRENLAAVATTTTTTTTTATYSHHSYDYEDEEARKRRIYAKPVPKEFEKAWSSNMPIPLSVSANLNVAANTAMISPSNSLSTSTTTTHKVPLLQLPTGQEIAKSKRKYENEDNDERQWQQPKSSSGKQHYQKSF